MGLWGHRAVNRAPTKSAPTSRDSSNWTVRFLFSALLVFSACWSAAAQAAIAVGSASQAIGTNNLIEQVGVGAIASRTDCGNISPSIPAGSAGDLLIALVNARENGATLTATGWTALVAPTTYPPDTTQEFKAAIYYRIATGTNTLTINQSGTCSSISAQVARFSGVDNDDPFDGVSAITSQNSDNIDASGLTTSVTDTRVMVAAFIMTNQTVTQPSGWDQAFDSTTNSVSRPLGLSLHHQLQLAAGAKSISNWDLSGSGNVRNMSVIFALNPATPRQVSIPMPSGTSAGNLLVASVTVRYNAATVTPPDGWTLVRDTPQASGAATCNSGTTAGIRTLTYYKVAAAGEPAAEFGYSAPCYDDGFAAGGIVRFTGVDPVSPIITSAAATTASNTTHAAPAVTPGVANTMLVTVHSYGSSYSWNEGYTGVNGMTERVDQRSYGSNNELGATLAMYTQPLTGAGSTGTRTAQGAGAADNGATHSLILRPTSADLSLAMVRGGPLSPSGTAAYTLTVTNNGPDSSSGTTTVVDTLPAYLTYTGFSGSGWSCSASGQTVTCTRASAIANGSSSALTLNVSVSPGASGMITNTATVSGGAPDNSPGNNTASDSYEIPLNCFGDNFDRDDLGADWSVSSTSGSFGNAQIVDKRLRLTDASGNVATAAHLQRSFPAAGNKIVVEFEHRAYGGTGADGIAVTLSNYSVPPVAGAYGGSLGYAQYSNPTTNGFAGGWLGIGLDEYGNFANPTEGRNGGPGFVVDSVTIRGSGSGTSGYRHHRTSSTLNPGIDQSALATISYVGSGGAVTASSGNVTPALPNAHQAGDLLLCQVVSRDNVATSMNTWTSYYSITHGTGMRSSLFWKIAGASESNPTVSHSNGSGIQARCSAFRNVDATTPFDVAYAAAQTTNDKITTGALTPVTNGAMILMAGYINRDRNSQNGFADTQGLTWTQDYYSTWNGGNNNSRRNAIALFHARQTTAGALNAFSYDTNGNANNQGVLMALRPATVAPAPHLYRITFDHSDSVHAYVKVERDSGAGYVTVIPQYDAKAQTGQADVPANWLLSYTGSTGGSTNIHEIDNLSVCTIQPISSGGPHHLRIEHSGNGLTCTPSTLTIKACANAECSTPYTGGVTGTLAATGTPTVNWVEGPGFSIDSSGSTTKQVQVTTPGAVVWGTAGDTAPAASNPTACYVGVTASCNFTSAQAGFLLDAPNHVSDEQQTFTISAVKQDDDSLACTSAFANVSKTVSFNCAYSDPDTGTLPVAVGGGNIACGSGGNVSLNFNASGVASTTLRYADVGLVTLTASYTGSSGSEIDLEMTGSDDFIAAPASFTVTPSGPYVAGRPFGVTVTAKNASGGTTPNFGQENQAEEVSLAHQLVAPAGGATGSFSGTISNFVGGVASSNDLIWDEVGNIKVSASLTGYLDSNLDASGVSATTSPFVPDHFDTAVVLMNMVCPADLTCPASMNDTLQGGFLPDGFVYSDQPFSVRVTAKNADGGTTLNYDGTRMDSDGIPLSKAATLTAWDAPGSTTTQNPGGGAVTSGSVAAAAFVNGVAATAAPAYLFNAVQTAPADIFVRAVDADDVSSRRAAAPGTSQEGGVKVASGRVRIGNAYGTELLPLKMDVTVEYWNGTVWLVSQTDATALSNGNVTRSNCTSGLGNPAPACKALVAVGNTVLAEGVGKITLTAPGANNSGSANLTLNAGNWPAWLPSNTARATFGVYRSNPSFIYMRERF